MRNVQRNVSRLYKGTNMNLCIKLYGLVQGVGFRPFALRLANELNLSGNVRNRNGIVIINITGDKEALDEYVRRLALDTPDGAEILGMDVDEISDDEYEKNAGAKTGRFVIAESDAPETREQTPVISPDIATCSRCEAQMYDKNDRRYMHPFISCTDCGPRYSIITDIPYDRETTSMRDFDMCSKCAYEYVRPQDIRCHAQTIACHECGPVLKLIKDDGTEITGTDALFEARDMLDKGDIIAVKDIGGYHFACRADNTDAVSGLRELKRRQSKSFAVMFKNVNEVKKYAYVNDIEEKCLISRERPIVLVKKLAENDIFDNVCGDSMYIGAMLASNPVQIYLANECAPLIMTSGNLGGEPIIISDEKMRSLVKSKGIIDGILCNDRKIVTPLDDSIVRVIDSHLQVLRRARGYVPLPVYLSNCKSKKTILASGGDLKAAFCYLKDSQAVCSQYFGDLNDYDAGGIWKNNISRIGNLYNFKPDILACDMHPRYYSAQMAKMMYDYEEVIEVQHHKAHIASVAAEHGLKGELLGFAFDGTGYGCDGTIWGGEVFLMKGVSFDRLTHLETIPMCGGDEIAKDADMALMCYLIRAGVEPEKIFDMQTPENMQKLSIVKSVLEYKIGITYSSSMGRLFDAASALIGIRHYNNYEGECAMALEKAAGIYETYGEKTCGGVRNIKYTLKYENGIWNTSDLIRQIAELKIQGMYKEADERNEAAYAFHEAIADAVSEYVYMYSKTKEGEIQIALSGGVFMNRLLTKMIIEKLKNDRFVVYFNEKVPVNDGGIALGQAYIAAGIQNNM